MTNIPELGVVSTHQKDDDWLSHYDGQRQQESPRFSSHQLKFRPPCDAGDRGVHVYVHPEDGFSKRGEESGEEVLHVDQILHSSKVESIRTHYIPP